jgi:hypothetical protein
MKDRPSKLDAHAADLDEMFSSPEEGGRGLTLDQAREELRLDGVSVSCSALSVWWANRRQAKLQERLLGQIASGARQVAEVEKAFAGHNAPEIETLVKLHRVLILKLSTQGNADPELLELVNRMMKPVVQFERLKQLQAQLSLDRDKFQQQTCELFLKWSKDAKAREIAESNVSNSEKIAQLRQTYFSDVDELERSGSVQIPKAS